MQASMLDKGADERAKHKAEVTKWETQAQATAAQVSIHLVDLSLHA